MYICCVHFMLISFKVCKQACNLQDLSNTNVNKFIETFAIQRIVLIFFSFVVHQEDYQLDLTPYYIYFLLCSWRVVCLREKKNDQLKRIEKENLNIVDIKDSFQKRSSE